MESVVTKISKFIEFTPEQKERAATVNLEEFLLRQGEKLIKSGREKRLAIKGGSVCTSAWYEKYHAVKCPVPARGIFFILPTFFRVQRNKGNIKAV